MAHRKTKIHCSSNLIELTECKSNKSAREAETTFLRVLIVKMSSIGDILQCFFAPCLIKKLYPGAQVDWLVEKRFTSLVEAHPYIDQVIAVDMDPMRRLSLRTLIEQYRELHAIEYDLLFDLQGNMKSGLMTFLSKAHEKVGMSYDSVTEWPNVLSTHIRYSVDCQTSIQHQYASIIKKHLNDTSPFIQPEIHLNLSQTDMDWLKNSQLEISYKTVMVCFGSNWENKKLFQKDLRDILYQVTEEIDIEYLFVYGIEEERKEALNLANQFPGKAQIMGGLSFALWQYFMSKCHGVICMDSAALHLASLVRTKTFAFFGPSNSAIYNPSGRQHACYQGTCPYGEVFAKRCRYLRSCSTGDCLHQIDTRQVAFELKAWLTHQSI